MDIESKKQELIKRSQYQKDQFINKIVNELSIFLQQQKELQEDLNDLENLKKPDKK